MDRAGALLNITARPSHPIVFQVAPTAFQRAGENPPAMAVAAQHPAFLNPENVGVHVVPDIERQMTDEHVLDVGNIGRFILSRTDMNVWKRVFLHDRIKAVWYIVD